MEMCKVLWFAILEIILVHSVQMRGSRDEENWRVHQKRITEFSCETPQPRSLRLEDIVDEEDLPDLNMQVFPEMTVLHRCDYQTGCCRAGRVCAPQVTEDVSLTFRIIVSKVNKRHASNGLRDNRYLHVVASNHTYCSCQMEHDLPK